MLNVLDRQPFIKVALRYGLLGSAVGSAAIFVLYQIGRHPFLLPIIVDFRILLFTGLMIFCLREIRDYLQEGILYFWQSVMACYIVVITASTITSLFVWGLATWHRDFLGEYIRVVTDQLTKNKQMVVEHVGKQAYEQQMGALPGTSALDLAADYFLKSLFISLFLTIVLSIIFRRTPKTN